MTLKDVVELMVEWQQQRYLDPGVWNYLRPKFNSRLMPILSIVQPRCEAIPNIQELHLEDSVRVKVIYSSI